MSEKKVDFEISCTIDVQAFLVSVGNIHLKPNSLGKASVNLEGGRKYFLRWWLIGNEGGAISIVGRVGNKDVVEVKKSTIPQGQIEAANALRFPKEEVL